MRAFKKRQSSNSNIENIIPNQEPTPFGTATPTPTTAARESGESRVNGDLRKSANKECETDYKRLARRETKAVKVLRVLVLVLLFVTATLTSVGVYFYLSNEETQAFESGYQAKAQRIIESFHDAVERRMGAVNSMATAITSHSLATKQTFPFVTIPNFEIRGSDLRVQAASTGITWLPLVKDETRVAWEDYALANRNQISRSFQEDKKQKEMQDDAFGFTNTTGTRMLQQGNILNDGTEYHPRIWSLGNPAQDSIGNLASAQETPEGSGPYLPLWQSR
jgi:hypothetical protein